jgi:para-aminobenzoate synthetase/4-amino-4-deoxychorismate lyase
MTRAAKPDPARGLFETLLVLEGRPVELGSHLRRLATSLEAVYGQSLPEEIAALARERAAGLPLGRLQLTVGPGGDGLECKAVAAATDRDLHFPAWEGGARLRSLPFPGGLGAHKWADRSPLPAWGDAVPLLLDGEDVLEASRANVFAAHDGVLSTPPLDGRILPGITRAAVLEIARGEGLEVRERHLGREELRGADEVFLTGSVRGVEPARSLDGEALGRSAALSGHLADRLRRRWDHSGKPAAPKDPRSLAALGGRRQARLGH